MIGPPTTASAHGAWRRVPGGRFYSYKTYNAQKPAINHDGSVMVFAETSYTQTYVDGVAKYRSSIGRVAVTRFDGVRYSLAQYLVGEYQNDGVAETAISASGRRIAFSSANWEGVRREQPGDDNGGQYNNVGGVHICDYDGHEYRRTTTVYPHTIHTVTETDLRTAQMRFGSPFALASTGTRLAAYTSIGAPEFQNGGRVWIYDERADGTWSNYYNIDGDRDQLTTATTTSRLARAARCSPSRTTRRTTPRSRTRAASTCTPGGVRAACPPPAPPVGPRAAYAHSTELPPGSYEDVPGTELGGWKGAFDYDQGMYFRFTTTSGSESIIIIHSGCTVAPQLA